MKTLTHLFLATAIVTLAAHGAFAVEGYASGLPLYSPAYAQSATVYVGGSPLTLYPTLPPSPQAPIHYPVPTCYPVPVVPIVPAGQPAVTYHGASAYPWTWGYQNESVSVPSGWFPYGAPSVQVTHQPFYHFPSATVITVRPR